MKTRGFEFFLPADDEQAFVFSSAPAHLEPYCDPLPCPGTVRSWAYVGRKSRSGKNCKLKVCYLPGGLATSLSAYRQFIEELNT
jgi:hypothetical protein